MSLPLIPGVVSNQTIRTVEHAAQLLVEHDMSAVVVTSPEGQLVGIVTERDPARGENDRFRASQPDTGRVFLSEGREKQ